MEEKITNARNQAKPSTTIDSIHWHMSPILCNVVKTDLSLLALINFAVNMLLQTVGLTVECACRIKYCIAAGLEHYPRMKVTGTGSLFLTTFVELYKINSDIVILVMNLYAFLLGLYLHQPVNSLTLAQLWKDELPDLLR